MFRSSRAACRSASIPFRLLVAIAAVFLISALLPASSRAQIARPSAWVTNGRVLSSAYASSNNVLYLGGTFTQVGPAVGGGAALGGSTGVAQQPDPLVVGTVMAVAPDGNGGWYLGGLFTSVQ